MKYTSDTSRAKQLGEEGRRYLNFLKETSLPFCWACGRDDTQKPDHWYAPWKLTLAHLAAGGSKMKRHLDRRAVILLCPLCHALHTTNGNGSRVINGQSYSQLSNGNVLYLKQARDPDNWDLNWITERWMGQLPELVEPASWFMEQYASRRS